MSTAIAEVEVSTKGCAIGSVSDAATSGALACLADGLPCEVLPKSSAKPEVLREFLPCDGCRRRLVHDVQGLPGVRLGKWERNVLVDPAYWENRSDWSYLIPKTRSQRVIQNRAIQKMGRIKLVKAEIARSEKLTKVAGAGVWRHYHQWSWSHVPLGVAVVEVFENEFIHNRRIRWGGRLAELVDRAADTVDGLRKRMTKATTKAHDEACKRGVTFAPFGTAHDDFKRATDCGQLMNDLKESKSCNHC